MIWLFVCFRCGNCAQRLSRRHFWPHFWKMMKFFRSRMLCRVPSPLISMSKGAIGLNRNLQSHPHPPSIKQQTSTPTESLIVLWIFLFYFLRFVREWSKSDKARPRGRPGQFLYCSNVQIIGINHAMPGNPYRALTGRVCKYRTEKATGEVSSSLFVLREFGLVCHRSHPRIYFSWPAEGFSELETRFDNRFSFTIGFPFNSVTFRTINFAFQLFRLKLACLKMLIAWPTSSSVPFVTESS